jgi:rubrerythrin|tara:strand:- start:249 stop:431 length:183 start_codon:yes stop_codon:yes gene_type:complete
MWNPSFSNILTLIRHLDELHLQAGTMLGDDFLTSICPHCGFLLGAFIPGMPCPECGEPLL